MRGLPTRTRLNLQEQDATPSLDTMVSFAQRFRALDTEHSSANSTAHLSTGKTTHRRDRTCPHSWQLSMPYKWNSSPFAARSHNSDNKQDHCSPPEELPAMNVTNEAIMLEVASRDRTLLELPQIILVILVILIEFVLAIVIALATWRVIVLGL